MKTEIILNDKHSKLNATRIAEVITPNSEAGVIAAIREAAQKGTRISICGGRHAVGGQQFGTDTVLLDLCDLRSLGEVDEERGLVEVGAGMMWPELINGLHLRQVEKARTWSIRQKQTGADDLTPGGSLAANIHSRGLEMKPIDKVIQALAERVAEGCLYGDFQYSIDEKSEGFLNEGVLSSYGPVDPEGRFQSNWWRHHRDLFQAI